MSVLRARDRTAAIDCLLTARHSCQDVRDTTLPGTPLYVCMETVIREIDAAIQGTARMSDPKATKTTPRDGQSPGPMTHEEHPVNTQTIPPGPMS